MIKNNFKMRLALENPHLLDIFTDNHYLELGNINYEMWTRLLNSKTLRINDIVDFNIQNKGVGASRVTYDNIKKIIPYINFLNIYKKNQSLQLFITYGLLVNKSDINIEQFSPIVLIPVNIFLENNNILIKIVSLPIENKVLINYLKSIDVEVSPSDKLDSVYLLDKYCLSFQKHDFKVKVENYLTFANTIQPPIIINHDNYSLKSQFNKPLGSQYYRDETSEIYNISLLNNRQRTAVQKASTGNSFAITGVLGTGKTTTLINIASDAIYRNKKILYISNMKETLDRVEEEFNAKGLKFLINNLTNTNKYVIDKDKKDKSENKNHVTSDKLKDLKKQLTENYDIISRYEKFLSGRIVNFRFIEIIKELLTLKKDDPDFEVDNLDEVYKVEYEEIIKSLVRIEEAMKKTTKFKESKFINIPINHNIKYPNQIITLLFQIHKLFTELNIKKQELENKCGFNNIPNYARFKNVINNFKALPVDKVPDVWKQDDLANFKDANMIYPTFKNQIYSVQEYELYIDWDYKDLSSIDVQSYINLLLGEYFTEEDVEDINNVITYHQELISKVKAGTHNYRLLQKSVEKIQKIINWNFDIHDDETLFEIERLTDFLNNNIYHKKWLNKSKQKDIKKEIGELQIKLGQFIALEKQYYKYFSNNEIDNNINSLKRVIESGKISKKYKNVDIDKLIIDIEEYKHLKKGAQKLNKRYSELTGFEYSTAYNVLIDYDKFIFYLNSFPNEKTESIFYKFLLVTSDEDLDIYLQDFSNFKRSYQILNQVFGQVSEYIPFQEINCLIDKGECLNKISKYLNHVRSTNQAMQDVVKSGDKIIGFETYLKLRERLNHLHEIKAEIRNNSQYMALFGTLFENEKTNINEIGSLIKNFNSYLDCFKDSTYVNSSFKIDDYQYITHLIGESSKIIYDINETFKLYSKIFKDGIGGYYYDDFNSVIEHLSELLKAKDELKIYLEITDNLKVLSRHKLYIISNYIINNEITDLVDNFKYKYFSNLYRIYMEENQNIPSTKEIEAIISNTIDLENAITEKHILELADRRSSRVNYLINDNANVSKALYLSTTTILNYYLDYRKFDVIIIDDAHLLNANEYYNAVLGSQVIIAGEEQSKTTLTSNLISRMRSNNVMSLNYRYSTTPLKLLTLIKGLNGTFISKVSENGGVETIARDVSKYIASLFLSNNNLLINYYTPLLSTKVAINENIAQILADNNIDEEIIYTILRKRLNVVDLFAGYNYDADYNIIDIKDYYQSDNEYLDIHSLTSLLTTKKKLIIIDNDNLLRKETDTSFIKAIAPVFENHPIFNLDINEILLKLASELNKFGIIVHGSHHDLSLVIEKNNTYYGILLFCNPDTSHLDLIEDYREYYEVYRRNNMKVLIVWILDLLHDFNGVVNYLNKEIQS
jgi:hypothetical protein